MVVNFSPKELKQLERISELIYQKGGGDEDYEWDAFYCLMRVVKDNYPLDNIEKHLKELEDDDSGNPLYTLNRDYQTKVNGSFRSINRGVFDMPSVNKIIKQEISFTKTKNPFLSYVNYNFKFHNLFFNELLLVAFNTLPTEHLFNMKYHLQPQILSLPAVTYESLIEGLLASPFIKILPENQVENFVRDLRSSKVQFGRNVVNMGKSTEERVKKKDKNEIPLELFTSCNVEMPGVSGSGYNEPAPCPTTHYRNRLNSMIRRVYITVELKTNGRQNYPSIFIVFQLYNVSFAKLNVLLIGKGLTYLLNCYDKLKKTTKNFTEDAELEFTSTTLTVKKKEPSSLFKKRQEFIQKKFPSGWQESSWYHNLLLVCDENQIDEFLKPNTSRSITSSESWARTTPNSWVFKKVSDKSLFFCDIGWEIISLLPDGITGDTPPLVRIRKSWLSLINTDISKKIKREKGQLEHGICAVPRKLLSPKAKIDDKNGIQCTGREFEQVVCFKGSQGHVFDHSKEARFVELGATAAKYSCFPPQLHDRSYVYLGHSALGIKNNKTSWYIGRSENEHKNYIIMPDDTFDKFYPALALGFMIWLEIIDMQGLPYESFMYKNGFYGSFCYGSTNYKDLQYAKTAQSTNGWYQKGMVEVTNRMTFNCEASNQPGLNEIVIPEDFYTDALEELRVRAKGLTIDYWTWYLGKRIGSLGIKLGKKQHSWSNFITVDKARKIVEKKSGTLPLNCRGEANLLDVLGELSDRKLNGLMPFGSAWKQMKDGSLLITGHKTQVEIFRDYYKGKLGISFSGHLYEKRSCKDATWIGSEFYGYKKHHANLNLCQNYPSREHFDAELANTMLPENEKLKIKSKETIKVENMAASYGSSLYGSLEVNNRTYQAFVAAGEARQQQAPPGPTFNSFRPFQPGTYTGRVTRPGDTGEV